MRQAVLALERQAMQLVTVEAQAPLSQMPLMLKKFRAHSLHLLAELQRRQLLRGTEQAVQPPAFKKYPLLQAEQMILPPAIALQVVQKETAVEQLVQVVVPPEVTGTVPVAHDREHFNKLVPNSV